MQSRDEKRRLECSILPNFKRKKYYNLIDLILNSELSNESKKEFEALLEPETNQECFYTDELHEALYHAALKRRKTWIDFLLKKGADPIFAVKINESNDRIVTAVDEAWKNQDFDVVLKLIEADSFFPQQCTETLLIQQTQLKKITRERLDLHEHIKSENIEGVKRFVKQNVSIKRAYNNEHNSALKTALKSKSFVAYAFLRSNGFVVDDEHDEEMERLGKRDKKVLEIEIKKYFKTADIHILDLLSKSQLAPSNGRENFEKIKELYEALDCIPECQSMLKIAANCEGLKIFFDFDRDDINELEPTTVFQSDVFLVQGRTYCNLAVIKIAARREPVELLGTLAQEFAHFALLKTYKNEFLPFKRGDDNQRTKYDQVISMCRKIKNKSEVIDSVFKYEDTKIGKELVVRVPQLMAMYGKSEDERKKLRVAYKDLFQFYDLVLKDFEKEVVLIGLKEKIRQVKKKINFINSRGENVICSENLEIDFDRILSGDDDIFIISNTPKQFFNVLIEKSKDFDNSMIFCFARQLVLPDISKEIRNDFDKILKPRLVVLDSLEIDLGIVKNLLSTVKLRTVFISNRSSDVFEDLLFENMSVQLHCGNLNKKGKQQIFNQVVKFHNEEVILKDIIFNFEIFNAVPLEVVSKIEVNSLKSVFTSIPDFLVNRLFKSVKDCESFKFGRLCNHLLTARRLILTGSAGIGKTVSATLLMKNLKSLHPKRWMVFISLGNIECISKAGQLTPSFLGQKLLRLENKFEQKVFEHFYDTNRTIFVFDSFETINPRNNKFVISVFKAILKSQNILIVTTQPHFTQELENLFEITATELMPFSKEDQVDFLSKVLQSNCSQLFQDDLKKKAESMLDELLFNGVKNLENPQLLQQFAVANIFNHDFAELIQNSAYNNKSLELFNMYLKQGADVNVHSLSENDEPLLLNALRRGQFEWIPLLIENGANVRMVDSLLTKDFDGGTATEIALKNEKYDIVLKLLYADAAFPKEMTENQIPEGTKFLFADFSREREKLHENIYLNQQEGVEKFIADNPKVKCAYTIENKCALSTALDARSFKIYAFLRSRGFSKGIDKSHDEIMKSLTELEVKSLEVEIRNFFLSPKSYIMELVSKSCLGLNSNINFFERIPNKFEALDSIQEMQPILKIAASVPSLTIVFDFNQRQICDFSVSRNFNKGRKSQAFAKSGTIQIGTKNKIESDVLCSLAFELTLFTLNYVFNNNGLPYYFDDDERKSTFNDIFKKYQSTSYVNEKIQKLGKEFSVIPSISRLIVSHAIEQDQLDKSGGPIQDLFDYFRNSVLKELETEVLLFDAKRKVRDLNKAFGLLKKINSAEIICFDFLKNGNIFKNKITLLQSSHPEFLLKNLLAHLKNHGRGQIESTNIFAEMNQLLHLPEFNSIQKDLEDCLQSAVQPCLIILDSNSFESEECENILSKYLHQERNIVFISNKTFRFETFSCQVQIKWKDLRQEIKENLLKTFLIFQNSKVFLQDLAKIEPKSFDELLTEPLVHSEKIEISVYNTAVLEKTSPVNITRFLKSFPNESQLLPMENVVHILDNLRTLIIAGPVGSGKTMSAIRIANTLKSQHDRLLWPVFINVHDFLHSRDKLHNPADKSYSFFDEIFACVESPFERSFLKYVFNNSRIIFIFDGYEETRLYQMKYFHKLIKMIQNQKHYLIVTTRSYFLPYINKYIKGDAVEIAPLTKFEQIKFLSFFAQRNTISLETAETKATDLIEKITNDFPEIIFLTNLHYLSMISELQFDSVNAFILHDYVFKKKYKLSFKNENKIVEIAENHKKIALELIFDQALVSPLPPIVSQQNEENNRDDILNFGLVSDNAEKKLYFEHKSFAEYFAALYIFEKITSKSNQSDDKVQALFAKVIFEHQYHFIKTLVENQNVDKTIQEIVFFESFLKCPSLDVNKNHEENARFILTLLLNRNFNHSTHLQLEVLRNVSSNFEIFKELWMAIERFTKKNQRHLLTKYFKGKYLLSYALNDAKVFKFVVEKMFDTLDENECMKLLTISFSYGKGMERNLIEEAAATIGIPAFTILWNGLLTKFGMEKALCTAIESTTQTHCNLFETENSVFTKITVYYIEFYTSNDFKSFLDDFYHRLKCINEQSFFLMKVFEFSVEKESFFKEFLKIVKASETYTMDLQLGLGNLLHCANLKTFQMFWSLFEISDQKTNLLRRDQYGNNMLLRSVLHNKSLIKFVLNLFRELISAKEFSLTLQSESNNWIIKTIEKYAYSADYDAFKLFWSLLKEKLEISDQKKILLDSAMLKLSVENTDMSSVEFVLELVENLQNSGSFHDYAFYVFWLRQNDANYIKKIHYKNDDIRNFLLKSYFGSNLIFHSTEVDSKRSQLLWKSSLDYLQKNEIQNLLFAKNSFGESALTNSTFYGNHLLLDFLEWLNLNLDHNELNSVFNLKYECSSSLMHLVAERSDDLLSKTFLNFVSKNFSEQEKEKLFSEQNDNKENPVQISQRNWKIKEHWVWRN